MEEKLHEQHVCVKMNDDYAVVPFRPVRFRINEIWITVGTVTMKYL